MFTAFTDRNVRALSAEEITLCQRAWALITTGGPEIRLDVSAARDFTWTGYQPGGAVILGANVLPGGDLAIAGNRASLLAVLAHEYAHAIRHDLGFQRPLVDQSLDEAESCIHAAFTSVLSQKDREDLIECARDFLEAWLAQRRRP